MQNPRYFIYIAVLLCLHLPACAADKNKTSKAAESSRPSYELPQPATETLDYTMYQRIREEGIAHSRVMEYASPGGAVQEGFGAAA